MTNPYHDSIGTNRELFVNFLVDIQVRLNLIYMIYVSHLIYMIHAKYLVGKAYFANTCDGEFRNLLSIVYYNFAMHVRLSYVSLLDEV